MAAADDAVSGRGPDARGEPGAGPAPGRVDPRAGKLPDPSMLVNVPRLVADYFALHPDPRDPRQRVVFGTSGHRGSAFEGRFNEDHVLAITEAICRWRHEKGIEGPLFLGIDTHALSEPAFTSALEVLAAHEVEVRVDARGEPTPTPAVSHAILAWRREHGAAADGIVISPSHNPPDDGGFKYDPPSGGPAAPDVTGAIEREANRLLDGGLREVRRMPFARALAAPTTRRHDFREAYVADLGAVVDLDAIRGAGLRLGVDPLGGAGVRYWEAIAERWRVPLKVVSDEVDPSFRFMTVDHDGKIRMDCSSPWAMRRLTALRDRFDVAWACDTDHDRHGVVSGPAGLMEPNAYLAVAIDYLLARRPGWPGWAAVGKTAVSSALIDRVTARAGRTLFETPVGFRWFVQGLLDSRLAFAGEESAGASCLRRDGMPWTTDKDGIVLGLLAAEMTAVTGRTPATLLRGLAATLGEPAYERVDVPATPEEKAALARLDPASLGAGSGACPVCGSPPVAGVVQGGDRLRFLSCSLCASEWNVPRVRCVLCGGEGDLAYYEVEGDAGGRAEACPSCRAYVKLFDEEKRPGVDPAADDAATLALDLLLAEDGWSRVGANLYLATAAPT